MSQETINQKVNYYITPLNSLLAHSFVPQIKENLEANVIGKTDIEDLTPCNQLIDKIIPCDFPKNDLQILWSNCDTFIIEILKADYEEIEELLEFMSNNYFEERKKIIFVSHPILWYNSKKKVKNNMAQSEIFQQDSFDKNNEEHQQQQLESTTFNDSDFCQRKTLPIYEKYRLLENQLISLGKKNPQLSVAIFLPGIIYGKGEDDFYELFEKCLEAESLDIYLEGKNKIPVVQVESCSLALNKLAQQQKFEQELYIFNEENSILQKELIQTIADVFSIKQININQDYKILFEKDYLIRTINLNFKNSSIFQTDKIESISKFSNNNCQFSVSFLSNFKHIFEEYIEYRGVQRVKGIIFGLEEALEKNNIFEDLQKKFDIKVYDPYQMLLELKQYEFDKQDSAYLHDIQQRLKKFQNEQIDFLYQQHLEKNQKQNKKNQQELTKEDIKFDAYLNPPNSILIDFLLYYLQQPLQIFKGYLLRNFPRTHTQAFEFLTALQKKNLRDDFDFILKIVPDFEKMQEKLKNHQKFGSKDPAQKLKDKQIDFYERFMNWQDSFEELSEFFEENNFQVKKINFMKMELDTELLIKSLMNDESNFTQRNFELQSIEEVQEKSKQEIDSDKENQQSLQNLQDIDQQQNLQENLEKNQSNSELNSPEKIETSEKDTPLDYLSQVKQHELQRLLKQQDEVLEEKSTALKQYLADIILPDVTEAIIEICKQKPQDPITFLIQFLKSKQQVNLQLIELQ